MKNKIDFLTSTLLYAICVVVSLSVFSFYVSSPSSEDLEEDEIYYFTQASKLVSGNYEINSYRPIGHPLILATALYLSQSNFLGMNILLILFACLRAPLLYLLVKKIIGNYAIAVISALLVIVWPTILYYSLTIYSETTSLTMFLMFLLLLPKGTVTSKYYQWILAGIFYGFTVMIHPMYLLFAPFIILIICLEGDRFKTSFFRIILVLVSAFLVVAPWSLAISLKERSFYLVSTNSLDAIAGTLNSTLIREGYTVTSTSKGRKTISGPGLWTHKHGYLTTEESALPEKQRNEILYQRLLDWIKEHPADTLYLELAKMLNLWGFYPWIWEVKKRVLLGNLSILIILFLSLGAIWKFRKNYRELSRFWTIPIFVSLIGLMTVGLWRYRLPADVALIVLSTIFIYALVKKIGSDDFKKIED